MVRYAACVLALGASANNVESTHDPFARISGIRHKGGGRHDQNMLLRRLEISHEFFEHFSAVSRKCQGRVPEISRIFPENLMTCFCSVCLPARKIRTSKTIQRMLSFASISVESLQRALYINGPYGRGSTASSRGGRDGPRDSHGAAAAATEVFSTASASLYAWTCDACHAAWLCIA